MATIHSLAPEILSDIFELAHDPREPSTMCAAALVCRAWRDPAQRALFLDVCMPTVKTYGYFSSSEYNTRKTEQEVVNCWENYLTTQLHTPRRAEVRRPSARLRLDRLFHGLSGLKHLVITGGDLSPGFLSDPNLREIERLDLTSVTWINDSDTIERQSWPVNLRDLRLRFTQIDPLMSSYHKPSAPLSLAFEISKRASHRKLISSPEAISEIFVDLEVVLPAPNVGDAELPIFLTKIQNLHRLTLDLWVMSTFFDVQLLHLPSLPTYLQSLAGALPASIKRLGIKMVAGVSVSERTTVLSRTPFTEILELFSNDRLPNLTRIDFPDCKRKDLEEEVRAANLLAECERQSIRVVCWEEFL